MLALNDGTTFRTIVTPFQSELNQSNVSWKGGINFQPNKDILLYGLVSRGYKSGSFPTVPASTTAQFRPVTQERVTAYEAGVKITALTGRLQINAAGFHYQYDDKQVRGIILDPIFNQLEAMQVARREAIGHRARRVDQGAPQPFPRCREQREPVGIVDFRTPVTRPGTRPVAIPEHAGDRATCSGRAVPSITRA